MISLRQLAGILLLFVCAICPGSQTDYYPEHLFPLKLDDHDPSINLHNWACLLQDLAFFEADAAAPLSFPELNSSINDGLQLINQHCRSADRATDTCLLSSFEDLAFAFSKMNQWWSRAIWDSATDPSTLALFIPLSAAISTNVLLNKRALIKMIKPKVKIIAGRQWAWRTDWLPNFGRPAVATFLHKVFSRQGRKKAKKYGDMAFRTLTAALNYSLIYAVVTSAKVAMDMTFSDLGAFYYFIYKHTLGEEFAYNNWYAEKGSWIYRFDNAQSMYSASADYTARKYFSVELDMELYKAVLVSYLSHLLPWSLSGTDGEPLVTKPELTSEDLPLLLESLESSEIEDQISDFLLRRNQCSILTLDARDSYFPSFYLSLCFREMQQIEFQLFNSGPRFILLRENMSVLIRHLLRITNTQRLLIYSPSTALSL